MDAVQHEQEQFPHFFSWLNSRQHKTKRPASAMHRPHSGTTPKGSNKGLPTANNTLQQHQHQQHRRSASPPAGAAVGRTSCSGSLIGSRPASAVKPRRPVSAAPNLTVAAQRLSADSTLSAQAPATRPFSASHAVRMPQQQQRQSSNWQQQQQQRSGLQQSFAACVQGHRPMPASTQPGSIHQQRMNSADPRLQQQHQWQPQGPTRPGSALVLAKQHRMAPVCLLPRAGSAAAASLAPPWLQAHTAAANSNTHVSHPPSGSAAATAAVAASGTNGSGCSCSNGTAASAAAGCSRPCSALVQAGSRLSRPSSPSCVRPGSRAGPGNGAAVGSSGTAGGSPWAAFGADAPLVWQRVSSADTRRYLQQQQEALAQQQHQPQQQQDEAGQEHPAAEQGEGLHEQDSQQAEDADSWQGTGLAWQQQQQQCCHHQSALQLFRQLPLSGAAAHASVTREVLQQMTLGLQIELQGVGAPLELELPAALGQDSSGGEEQEEAGVAMRQGVPDDWSARQQVARELHIWQKLTAELLRQTHLECSERGQLLQAAVDRQQQLLQQALTACDDVYQGLIASAATQQQQQEAMLSARADVQTLQQDNILLKALLEAKQAKLVSTAVELDEQRERMRRGRFHLIHEQVQEARMEVEKRVLRDLESHVHKARAAVQEAASARQQVLVDAVEDLAGHEVVEAVLKKLQEHEEAVLQQGQQREQVQERQEQGQDGQEEDPVAAQSSGS